MKYLIASDLHGDIQRLKELQRIFIKEKCEFLILLGDTFDFFNEDISSTLDEFINVILIKGNCDHERDCLLASMIPMEELDLSLNGFSCHLEHGHHLRIDDSRYQKYDMVFYGHTHMHNVSCIGDTYFINPGSASRARGGQENSFLILDENELVIYTLDMRIIYRCLLSR